MTQQVFVFMVGLGSLTPAPFTTATSDLYEAQVHESGRELCRFRGANRMISCDCGDKFISIRLKNLDSVVDFYNRMISCIGEKKEYLREIRYSSTSGVLSLRFD